MPNTPTIRSLAAALGVSRSTVSEALRGSPRLRKSTVARIRAAATEAGYRRNPLAGTLMSEMRRSRGDLFRGVLATINFDVPDRPSYLVRYQKRLVEGAKARAEELGFHVEHFDVGPNSLPLRRLDQILRSRGIQGLMLLPAWHDQDLTTMDWSAYSAVYMDYHIEWPALHCVCTDHFRGMTMALQRLDALGYRRPGLVLPHHYDGRLNHRWEGAFLAFRRDHPTRKPVPPLIAASIEREGFTTWFRKHQPDVVLSHFVESVDWMQECGASVPDTHGFFCLNLLHAEQPCAGLDLAPQLIGSHSVELVVAQMHRNELGAPPSRAFVTLPSTWTDGPTVRAHQVATAAGS